MGKRPTTGNYPEKFKFEIQNLVFPEDSDGYFDLLLKRLGIDDVFTEGTKQGYYLIDEQKYDNVRVLLIMYYNDVIEKVNWYRKRISKELISYWFWISMVTVVGVSSLILPLAAYYIFDVGTLINLSDINVTFTQIALFSGGAYHSLKIFQGTTRNQNRFPIFHDAYFSLKELMYKFEEDWRYKPKFIKSTEDGSLSIQEDFIAALQTVLVSARQIAKNERDNYYKTFKTPDEVLDKITASESAADSMQKLAKDALQPNEATQEKLKNREDLTKQLQEIEKNIVEKEASVRLTKEMLQELNQNSTENTDKIQALNEKIYTAETALLDLKAQKEATEAMLRPKTSATLEKVKTAVETGIKKIIPT